MGDDVLPQPWPSNAVAATRSQAALSCLLAQQRNHAGPEAFDWGKVSTKPYIRVVNRLIPEVDTDLDALDDEEQMSASKERRNLTDVFLEKRRAVSSLKLRTLLKVRVLTTCVIALLFQRYCYPHLLSGNASYNVWACHGLRRVGVDETSTGCVSTELARAAARGRNEGITTVQCATMLCTRRGPE